MGRQIEFIHTEEDIASFLLEIERKGGHIVHNQVACSAPALTEMILSQMATPLCQLFIASDCNINNDTVTMDVSNGTVIEFLNCRKGNPLSRVYEVGRLYLTTGQNSNYDQDTLLLYKELCAYIKMNYLFSPKAKLYYSPSFKAKYDCKYYHAAHLGRLLTL